MPESKRSADGEKPLKQELSRQERKFMEVCECKALTERMDLPSKHKFGDIPDRLVSRNLLEKQVVPSTRLKTYSITPEGLETLRMRR